MELSRRLEKKAEKMLCHFVGAHQEVSEMKARVSSISMTFWEFSAIPDDCDLFSGPVLNSDQ